MSGLSAFARPCFANPWRVLSLAALISAPMSVSPALAEAAPDRVECAREDAGARSGQSDQATTIRFVNDSGADKVVYWLNFDGLRVFYARLAPGESYDQQTFVSHPWVVTSDSYGTCEALWMPTPQPTVAQLR